MFRTHPLSNLQVEPGQVRFVHFLSPEKLRRYEETNRCRSRNDPSPFGRRVPRFLDGLGLSHLRRRKFLSMYVITEFTQSGSFERANGFSAGSNYAIELTLSSLNGRDVYVFNGDVQNLAAPAARKAAHTKFEGDVQALLSTISAWREELPSRGESHSFICEARLMKTLTPDLSPIFHVPDGSRRTRRKDTISDLLKACFEEDEE
jgi:hypothetical protein